MIGERVDFAQHTGAGPNPIRQKKRACPSDVPHNGPRHAGTGSRRRPALLVSHRRHRCTRGRTQCDAARRWRGARVTSSDIRRCRSSTSSTNSAIPSTCWNAIPATPCGSYNPFSTLPDDFAGASTYVGDHGVPGRAFCLRQQSRPRQHREFRHRRGGLAFEARVRHRPRGTHPRFFTLDPGGRWLLAANQNSDNVVVFALSDGRLGDVVCETGVPKPVCLLFFGSFGLNHGIRKFRQRRRSSQ